MIYKKLKEMGYGPDDWEKWTQEQANEVVAKGENRNDNKNEEKNKQLEKTKSTLEKLKGMLAKAENKKPKKQVSNFQEALTNVLGGTKYEKYIEGAEEEGKYVKIEIPEDNWRDRNKLEEMLSNKGIDVETSFDAVYIPKKQLK